MPAILVASKMKSGLPKPKPVHSALPIPQTHSRPSALALPVKTQVPPLGKQVGSGPPRSVTPGSEAGGNPQGAPVGADKRVIVSGTHWGIGAAEAVRLTQSAPSLSGNRRQCGERKQEERPVEEVKAYGDLLGLEQSRSSLDLHGALFQDSFLKPATSSCLDSFFLCGFVFFYAPALFGVQFDLDLVQMAYIEHRLPNQQSSSV
ncbi:hypothetical protein D9C73_004519 [Collichthys lucidus]|uniref:Uncharacterized protein n=1 Tax=Collichthys lucidus TaxID=240159 RepID=A0A4U5U984_COLLU|nr:hypothetical protein D9C73_004519 [Collichthys lucidus]